jgi:Fur family ferric uptake transcriptional regulator
MTAEEVLSVVQHRSHAVNIATIYRTLDILVREGIASRIDLGAGHALYATIKHGPHIHLYCRQCGMVIEVAQQDIAPSITTFYETMQQQYGFTPDRQHLALPGLCDQCSAKQTLETGAMHAT